MARLRRITVEHTDGSVREFLSVRRAMVYLEELQGEGGECGEVTYDIPQTTGGHETVRFGTVQGVIR